jgi:hypothetical protein
MLKIHQSHCSSMVKSQIGVRAVVVSVVYPSLTSSRIGMAFMLCLIDVKVLHKGIAANIGTLMI